MSRIKETRSLEPVLEQNTDHDDLDLSLTLLSLLELGHLK